MRNIIRKIMLVVVAVGLLVSGLLAERVFADSDEGDELTQVATSISISPVNKVLQLQPNTIYEDSFKVTNNGGGDMEFEVYASPYSYIYSEDAGEYQLGFSKENSYTQITRWITFKGTDGMYAKNVKFVANPGESVMVEYRITTPESLPDGGQYAVLFAHTLSGGTTSSGIRTEASPGLVIYGRSSNGETVAKAEITSIDLGDSMEVTLADRSGTNVRGETKNIINASGKVKNLGNVDFTVSGKLKVEGVFGRVYYETPSSEARVSVIPDTELAVSDAWNDTPYFGLFRATWTVSAIGESKTVSQMILILPAPIIVTMILLLTIIIVWIIIMVRKRRERRSRYKV